MHLLFSLLRAYSTTGEQAQRRPHANRSPVILRQSSQNDVSLVISEGLPSRLRAPTRR